MTQQLNNLATFVSIVKNQKLKKAADELSLTESAVSHQLSRLEQRLNVKLLNRSTKGVSLTPNGKKFYDQIEPALEQIDKALQQLQHIKNNKIILTMPQSFAAMWFSQRLHRLELEFPDVEFEIRPTQRVCNLEKEGIDIGIRTSREMLDSDNIIPLMQESLTPVCTQEIVENIQKMPFEEYIFHHGIILNKLHRDEWKLWCEKYSYTIPDKVKTRNLSTFDLVSNATLHGLGVAMGRTPLIDYHLEMGWLVKPFPDKVIQDHWYYIEKNRTTNTSVLHDRFIEWLVSECKGT